jgi:acyl-phosphate glycerol 3-phosphate acyltransferase
VIELIVKVLASYLVGSLIGSLIVGRLRGGVDIRMLGSGNAGGTNALRTQGKWFALWVMIIDIGKGILATRVIAPLSLQGLGLVGVSAGGGINVGDLREWLPVACGLAAMVGHVYPVWHGFRGGKGVATLVGVVFGRAGAAARGAVGVVRRGDAVWFCGAGVHRRRVVSCGVRCRERHAAAGSAAGIRHGRSAARSFYAPVQHRAHARRNRAAGATALAARPSP